MLRWKTLKRICGVFRNKSTLVDISPEVKNALFEERGIVALESTIITHGMPHPQNYETAITVENIIREQGCVPAHIAVCEGRIKVGLTKEQLLQIADPATKSIKTSRRDFPFVISNCLYGGTTVAGTLIVANSVGINIFVTGGIGGVHIDGENTLDISADLRELGRHPIMVVSSGIKNLLDIEKTLEYLETEGVCVVSYGLSKSFPAFYCEKSEFLAPYHVSTPLDAAKLLKSVIDFQTRTGILLAVPVPAEFSIDSDRMKATIEIGIQEANKNGITGKEITPYILNKINLLTMGKSLKTNIALIKNNAQIGAQVAKQFEILNKAVSKEHRA